MINDKLSQIYAESQRENLEQTTERLRNTTCNETFQKFLDPLPNDHKFQYNYHMFKNINKLNNMQIKNFKLIVPQKVENLVFAAKELQNCLASYPHKVNSGESFILLLKDIKDSKLTYAIEILHSNEHNQFFVNQYYGHKNSMPEKEHFQMFESFFKDFFEVNKPQCMKIGDYK